MRLPTIIGLTGPKGAGKTTVAELLCKHAKFSGIAFGDLLRHQVCDAFGVDEELFTRRDLKDAPTGALALARCVHLEFIAAMNFHLRKSLGDEAELFPHWHAARTPREILIFWAEVYRKPHYSPEYFSRAVVSKIYLEQSRHQWRHVVHDVRFPIEAKAIRSMGGVIWQIKHPDIVADRSDPTETDGGVFEPQVVINNCHDIKHLQAVVLSEWLRKETGLDWKDIADMGVVACQGMAS